MASGDEVGGNGGVRLNVLEDELGLDLVNMTATSAAVQELDDSV